MFLRGGIEDEFDSDELNSDIEGEENGAETKTDASPEQTEVDVPIDTPPEVPSEEQDQASPHHDTSHQDVPTQNGSSNSTQTEPEPGAINDTGDGAVNNNQPSPPQASSTVPMLHEPPHPNTTVSTHCHLYY